MLRSVNVCVTVDVPDTVTDEHAEDLAEIAVTDALDPVDNIRIVEFTRKRYVTTIER